MSETEILALIQNLDLRDDGLFHYEKKLEEYLNAVNGRVGGISIRRGRGNAMSRRLASMQSMNSRRVGEEGMAARGRAGMAALDESQGET